MNRLHKPALITIVAGALLGSLLHAQDQKAERDAVVKSFKQYIESYIQSYKTDNHERVHKAVAGWVRGYYLPDRNYNIDIRSTDSLISPYTGICEFTLVSHWTDFHKTKEEAERDDNFIRVESDKHRHTYAFQDGHWVPTLRQYYWPFEHEWLNCDECIVKTGEPLNDPEGCWEPNAKHPVTACAEQASSEDPRSCGPRLFSGNDLGRVVCWRRVAAPAPVSFWIDSSSCDY